MIDVMLNYEGYERKALGEVFFGVFSCCLNVIFNLDFKTYAWKTQRLVLRNDLILHPSFSANPTGSKTPGDQTAGAKSKSATPIPPLDVEVYLHAIHPETHPNNTRNASPEAQPTADMDENMQE